MSPPAEKEGERQLRSVHVLASIAERGAGTSHSVPALCEALVSAGGAAAIETVAGWRSSEGEGAARAISGVRMRAHPQAGGRMPLVQALCASPALKGALAREAPTIDILHAHGLWLLPNIYPAEARAGTSVRLVHSTRGMLGREALAFSRFKKQLFWMALQQRALASADCLHATGVSEYEEIRAAGLENPVAIIPNGVNLPRLDARPTARIPRTALSLGRIHPKKGLDRLVRAWARIEPSHPDWRMRIIGRGEIGHDDELRALIAQLGLSRISVEGPLYGADRDVAYRAADLFVLPTLNENFALTVAEALSFETPVICTKGAPWAGLETERCGWWIDHGIEPLANALGAAMAAPPEELARMGERGREWMARSFTWTSVAAEMLGVYGWLSGRADRPACVRMM